MCMAIQARKWALEKLENFSYKIQKTKLLFKYIILL